MTEERPLTLDDLKEQVRSLEPAAASIEGRASEILPHDLEIAFQLGQFSQRIEALEEGLAKLQRQLEAEQHRTSLRFYGYSEDIGNPVDREEARAAVCGDCGLRGQRFEAWRTSDSYRTFTVCPRCGNREEF